MFLLCDEEHSIWDESLLLCNCACSLEYSSLSTLAVLSYHIRGKLEVAFKASPSSQHQHCTDEAQGSLLGVVGSLSKCVEVISMADLFPLSVILHFPPEVYLSRGVGDLCPLLVRTLHGNKISALQFLRGGRVCVPVREPAFREELLSNDFVYEGRKIPVTPGGVHTVTVYVRDLPVELSDDCIKSAFSSFGEVFSISHAHFKAGAARSPAMWPVSVGRLGASLVLHPLLLFLSTLFLFLLLVPRMTGTCPLSPRTILIFLLLIQFLFLFLFRPIRPLLLMMFPVDLVLSILNVFRPSQLPFRSLRLKFLCFQGPNLCPFVSEYCCV